MKTLFNILRNIFAVVGVVFTVVLIYLCCSPFDLTVSRQVKSEDYVDVLKSSGHYSPDTQEFNIHPVADSARSAEIRAYFQLDTLYAPAATTWEKTLAIARFVASNIPHANQAVQPEKRNAIYLWEYTRTTEPAFNCRLHSILMFELLTSVGITATYVTCLPEDSNDSDCHVVNQVWLPEEGRWVMIDTDSGGTYATDEEGNILSLQEIREHYITDQDVYYHPEFDNVVGKENGHYYYMAKNTYWFTCWEALHYDQEPAYLNPDAGRQIILVPSGFTPFDTDAADLVTTDAAKFWAPPANL